MAPSARRRWYLYAGTRESKTSRDKCRLRWKTPSTKYGSRREEWWQLARQAVTGALAARSETCRGQHRLPEKQQSQPVLGCVWAVLIYKSSLLAPSANSHFPPLLLNATDLSRISLFRFLIIPENLRFILINNFATFLLSVPHLGLEATLFTIYTATCGKSRARRLRQPGQERCRRTC